MSTGYKVRYTQLALSALQETTEYISEETGPGRAAAWLHAIRASVAKLKAFPRAFPAVCLRRGRPIHSKVVMSHRVYYVIDDPARTVYIIDVIHTARETKLAEYRDLPG